MVYPLWDAATDYPVDSIVLYEGVPYQATIYHVSTNHDAPNVEVREVDPLFGDQRGWTVYERPQPAGTFGAIQGIAYTANKRPYDADDDWTLSIAPDNQVQEGPYGIGQSIVDYQGTTNSPSLQCPAADCQVFFNGGSVYSGAVNHYEFTVLTNPVLQTLPNGRTFYSNGPVADTNTSYVFFFHDAAWAVKRTFEVKFTRFTDPPTIETRTVAGSEKHYVRPPFILEQQPYPPFTAWDAPYFAPGFELFTYTWTLDPYNAGGDFKLTNVS